MKVLLVGNYPPDQQKSMAAFTAMLARDLPRLGCEVRLVLPPVRMQRLPMPRRLRKWAGYIDKFVLFPFALRRAARAADLVHICDQGNAMYVPHVRERPHVLTCHDVIAIQAARGMTPGAQVGRSGRLFQSLIARGLAQARSVVCISQSTERELARLALVDARRVLRIPNGLNNDFAPVAAPEAARRLAPMGLSPADDYLLHVGLDMPHKNRGAVLDAFIALQQAARAAGTAPAVRKLVFVGPPLDAAMAATAARHGVDSAIVQLENVSHEALCALYAGAVALLFPSLQEGFGWPVIEAQACGCPVFTSDLAPMNEIGGEAAVYVDPRDPAAMAAAIAAALPRRDAMRSAGLANAAQYTSQRMAASYFAVYREAIGADAAGRG